METIWASLSGPERLKSKEAMPTPQNKDAILVDPRLYTAHNRGWVHKGLVLGGG